MALFSMLRRPSYSALTRAIRAAGSATTFHRAISTIPAFSREPIRRSPIPTQLFSTATATKSIGDESMIGVIESEIKCAQDAIPKIPEVPDEFPFEIIDNPGESTIFLKREFQGEAIQVGVDIPRDSDPEKDDDDDEDDSEDEYVSEDLDPGIPYVVSISKRNGLQLEFGVSAFEDEITIDSLSIKHPEHSSEEIAYDGPKFEDLDESLQNAFYKYLDVRGINSSITNFLYDYMKNKDSKEYLLWLNNLKGFIE